MAGSGGEARNESERTEKPGPSYGPMSDAHWSRARAEHNREALDYYRQRSKAPGVAEGGGARNFYCMRCDGVIPFDLVGEKCPHCGAELDENVKRYFNWVEINEPPASDFVPLAKVAGLGLTALILLAALVWWWLK